VNVVRAGVSAAEALTAAGLLSDCYRRLVVSLVAKISEISPGVSGGFSL
jgi:hypothetical protein